MDTLPPKLPFDHDPTEEELDALDRAALAKAVADSDADPRTVPHEVVRVWLLRLARGEFDAPPPEPR